VLAAIILPTKGGVLPYGYSCRTPPSLRHSRQESLLLTEDEAAAPSSPKPEAGRRDKIDPSS
jgi:hypothetical protein